MITKASELSGAALDWAVAKANGYDYEVVDGAVLTGSTIPITDESDDFYGCHTDETYNPSTDWAQGGPIIERKWLDITPWPNESDEELRWQCKQHDSIDCVAFGPTPLIAAMRCYVASKLGDTVDVPDEFAKEV
jgi:hypothetical protein